MTDLFTVLAGGLNVLNSALALLQKLLELREKLRAGGGKKGKNKRSTKRTHHKNP